MKSIFQYTDYKEYFRDYLESLEDRARGEHARIAKAIRVNSSLLSQVFGGPRNLNQDQAFKLGMYWGFNKLQTQYFIALVQLERAGSKQLKVFLKETLDQIRHSSKDMTYRVPKSNILPDEDQSIFYSEWYYSAIRLLCDIKEITPQEMSERLGLPLEIVNRTLNFLQSRGLVEINGNVLSMGHNRTHLPSHSPFIGQHHRNWRTRAAQKLHPLQEQEFMYSSPLTISKKDALKVREILLEAVDQMNLIVKSSPSEELMCFSCDWIRIGQLQ